MKLDILVYKGRFYFKLKNKIIDEKFPSLELIKHFTDLNIKNFIAHFNINENTKKKLYIFFKISDKDSFQTFGIMMDKTKT